MGLSGKVIFDPTNGWCNYEGSSLRCNQISNGKKISPEEDLITDLQGFSHGSPGWIQDVSPVNRLQDWLTDASSTKTKLLENPAIIDEMELIDIGNFLAISLFQEENNLKEKYKEAIEYLNNHYFRGKYYRSLIARGKIACSNSLC